MDHITYLYGPGMSFYLDPFSLEPQPPLTSYSLALAALESSNHDLEAKVSKIFSNLQDLQRDLSRVQRHALAFHHELLVTWQADILTRLIEVVYSYLGRKLPFGGGAHQTLPDDEQQAPPPHPPPDRELMTRAYVTAAERIQKHVLRRQLGLSARYHSALRKYSEVAEFRSSDPFHTEQAFAQWLVSIRGKSSGSYGFWAKLFPICYGRGVDESAQQSV
ncbi:hypothetical protein ASPZODRAFT_1915830 [Penicilliopsis zonata CBS 506.65]|uniref:Uncharacterized protein n=1 Tax=Penicilliopsis zonata CBS 506.65 TaxID=1073090 RepID=A0A1L9SJ61_9EURO|nr:hypothetical protein ASPZODRAFT_1915830 [Penicilliopsis zonata CBS 506.65]OJJ47205.1 hypothetical protein ASPZODRAFT_1915830 [Penicilliopsis zonata CBS 506.65]